MLLPLKIFIPYFVALLVFFGIALLISFSKSSSETSQKREAELAAIDENATRYLWLLADR